MLNKIYENLEEATGVVLLAVMAVFAFLNVITRYFVQYSFAFTEEVEVACLVWLTMLGAAAGFRRGIHLGFDLVKMRFPGFNRVCLVPLAVILTVMCMILIIWFSISQIQDEIEFKTATEALNIPQWWYTIALPVGGILVIYRLAEATYKRYRQDR